MKKNKLKAQVKELNGVVRNKDFSLTFLTKAIESNNKEQKRLNAEIELLETINNYQEIRINKLVYELELIRTNRVSIRA